jgi:hypothetical protein
MNKSFNKILANMKSKTLKQQIMSGYEHEQERLGKYTRTFKEYTKRIEDMLHGRMPPPYELIEFITGLTHIGMASLGI